MARRITEALSNILCEVCIQTALVARGEVGLDDIQHIVEDRIPNLDRVNPRIIARQMVLDGMGIMCGRCIPSAIQALHDDARQEIAEGEGIIVPVPSPFPSPFPSPPTDSPPSPPPGPSPSPASSFSGLPPPAVPTTGEGNDSSSSDEVSHVENAPEQSQQQAPRPGASTSAIYKAWYQTPQWPARYGRLQMQGEQRRQWIADPSIPDCSVNPVTLTLNDLETRFPYEHEPRTVFTLGPDFREQAEALGLVTPREPAIARPWSFDIRNDDFTWMGKTKRGVIVLGVLARRNRDNDIPTMSEISNVLYTRNFPIETLRYVFVEMIANVETRDFLSKVIYAGSYNQQTLPSGLQTWEYDTPRYDALLGTQIGKIIAALVLGSFPRGTRRIGRIVTWNSDWSTGINNLWCHMRFDIENADGTAISAA
ncbi:hypothetical protein PENSTE_c013G01994 [Penicillium steckii]|uniref:Uncharacterized protein n=1 Tax=Penicillium steckii TaxID=303698 RepID=A0A1V6T313_9EURO|nr:hypothetical protein PENSTE_c013G01994 [Penicillium steckii]